MATQEVLANLQSESDSDTVGSFHTSIRSNSASGYSSANEVLTPTISKEEVPPIAIAEEGAKVASNKEVAVPATSEPNPQPTTVDTTAQSNSSKAKFVYVRPPHIEAESSNLWVNISFHCLTWRWLNFHLSLPLDTPVEIVRLKIAEHHEGTISSVVMYKDKVGVGNLLSASDPKKTLQQCGFRGGNKEDNTEAFIYYDFEPFQTSTFP
jgi:hypothetical protein